MKKYILPPQIPSLQPVEMLETTKTCFYSLCSSYLTVRKAHVPVCLCFPVVSLVLCSWSGCCRVEPLSRPYRYMVISHQGHLYEVVLLI